MRSPYRSCQCDDLGTSYPEMVVTPFSQKDTFLDVVDVISLGVLLVKRRRNFIQTQICDLTREALQDCARRERITGNGRSARGHSDTMTPLTLTIAVSRPLPRNEA
jgi:hypothetical protein